MIVETFSQPVTKFGAGTESSFSIKASPEAFKILANNLYPNKIRAVVRELSCNAYDSHIEAKNPEPFIVHCPNYLEPWFSVKDFGVGIEPEFMMGDYTTVFHSTKNGSNDTVGGLGLGRLSAFAYNDSYNAISITNGVQRHYVVFLAESGLPTITLLQESPTESPNGFEVNIPIKSNDFYEFEKEIVNFFSNINATCAITGTARTPRNQNPLLAGNGWAKYDAGSSQCYAKMGLIRYPISESHNISSFGIVIDFPIGSLEISPSREALSYSPTTRQIIADRLNEIEKEVYGLLQDKINACSSEWEAKLICDDIHKGIYSSIASSYSFKFKDKPLLAYYDIPVIVYDKFRRRKRLSVYPSSVKQFKPTKDDLYVIDDGPLFPQKRIEQFLAGSVNKVIVFPPSSDISSIDKPGGFAALSSLTYTPVVRKYTRKVRTLESGKRILELIDGKFTVPNNFSLDKPEFYVTVEKKFIPHIYERLNKTLHDLSAIGQTFRTFWVAPSLVPKLNKWVELFGVAHTILKQDLAAKASLITHEYIPRRTQEFFLKLQEITSYKEVSDITDAITKNNSLKPDSTMASLFSRYEIEIPIINNIGSRIEKFYAKKPMLLLCNNNVEMLERYQSEIKQYV